MADTAASFSCEQTTWTELEERRRTWWAIFIFDRAISLGSRRRFSCPEPTDLDVLPGNDVGWVRTPCHRSTSECTILTCLSPRI
jgi:hypothetical protein